MVSNWTCASAGPDQRRHAAGLGVEEPLQRRHAGRRPGVAAAARSGALPGRVPPIQFWLRRNSPGYLPLPAAAREQHRVDLAEQAVATAGSRRAAAQPVLEGGDVVRDLDHVVDRNARRLSSSNSSRSESDDCVPSICDESTASLRT